MLYREIIAVCSQIHTKHINTLCGQNVELLNVKLVVHIATTGLWRVDRCGGIWRKGIVLGGAVNNTRQSLQQLVKSSSKGIPSSPRIPFPQLQIYSEVQLKSLDRKVPYRLATNYITASSFRIKLRYAAKGHLWSTAELWQTAPTFLCLNTRHPLLNIAVSFLCFLEKGLVFHRNKINGLVLIMLKQYVFCDADLNFNIIIIIIIIIIMYIQFNTRI